MENMNITSAQYVTNTVFDGSTPENVSIRTVIDGVHIGPLRRDHASG
jgi:hypothetical protein